MTHHLAGLKIKNYRSCKDIEIELSNFTPIVGYNNAGKSNILSSIEWLLKDRLLSQSDYNDITQEISVEGNIAGITQSILDCLSTTHRARITPYIDNEKITIQRIQPVGATKKADTILKVLNPTTTIFDSNPTGIDNAISALFPEPIRIGAMENAADDATKAKATSTIGKILSNICDNLVQQHTTEVSNHINAINDLISHNGNSRISQIGIIDSSINTKIHNLFPGINLKLHFETPQVSDLLRAGTIKVSESPNLTSTDFTTYGHGTQRAIQMALIQHLADITCNTTTGSTTLLLIDEPELYLHPSAIEYVRVALERLASTNYQIIFTTHSAQIINSDTAPNTILIRKNQTNGTYCKSRLKDAISQNITNAQHQAEHLFSLTQSSKVLFADMVILAEGKTEQSLLPFLYEEVQGYTLQSKNKALISTNSVDNISNTMKILDAMSLPAKAIVDLDFAFRGAILNGYINANDADISALKVILNQMAANGLCTLDSDGLPKKSAICSAAAAFAIMATQQNASTHIDALHQKLLPHNIWIWKGGAIEVPLGLTGKKPQHWAAYKSRVKTLTFNQSCPDPSAIIDLAQWL
ncbi:AAA family ATPase [Klebsiella michiganensis]|uniref:ATP-dependent nuclease n=2 Tax=Klebsiella michiganensis TaxID=1134687 RepID=UPI0033742C64